MSLQNLTVKLSTAVVVYIPGKWTESYKLQLASYILTVIARTLPSRKSNAMLAPKAVGCSCMSDKSCVTATIFTICCAVACGSCVAHVWRWIINGVQWDLQIICCRIDESEFDTGNTQQYSKSIFITVTVVECIIGEHCPGAHRVSTYKITFTLQTRGFSLL